MTHAVYWQRRKLYRLGLSQRKGVLLDSYAFAGSVRRDDSLVLVNYNCVQRVIVWPCSLLSRYL